MCRLVQHVGVKVDAIRPYKRAGLPVDGHSREKTLILQRGEHTSAPTNPRSQVDRAGRPVSELERHAKWPSDANGRYPRLHRLLQWCDLERRLVAVKPAPVLDQFRFMECSPLDDESQGARRQLA